MDDILVTGRYWEDHGQKLNAVLQHLKDSRERESAAASKYFTVTFLFRST